MDRTREGPPATPAAEVKPTAVPPAAVSGDEVPMPLSPYVSVPLVQSSWGDTPLHQPAVPAVPVTATATAPGAGSSDDDAADGVAAGWSIVGSPLQLPRGVASHKRASNSTGGAGTGNGGDTDDAEDGHGIAMLNGGVNAAPAAAAAAGGDTTSDRNRSDDVIDNFDADDDEVDADADTDADADADADEPEADATAEDEAAEAEADRSEGDWDADSGDDSASGSGNGNGNTKGNDDGSAGGGGNRDTSSDDGKAGFEMFEVQQIHDRKRVRELKASGTITAADMAPAETDDSHRYHLSWVGFSRDEDTWEPSTHLVNCSDLMRKFLKRRRRTHPHEFDDDKAEANADAKTPTGAKSDTSKAALEARVSGGSDGDSAVWACSVCTFENEAWRSGCERCGELAPVLKAQKSYADACRDGEHKANVKAARASERLLSPLSLPPEVPAPTPVSAVVELPFLPRMSLPPGCTAAERNELQQWVKTSEQESYAKPRTVPSPPTKTGSAAEQQLAAATQVPAANADVKQPPGNEQPTAATSACPSDATTKPHEFTPAKPAVALSPAAAKSGVTPEQASAISMVRSVMVVLLVMLCALAIAPLGLRDEVSAMRHELAAVKEWSARVNATLALHGIDVAALANHTTNPPGVSAFDVLLDKRQRVQNANSARERVLDTAIEQLRAATKLVVTRDMARERDAHDLMHDHVPERIRANYQQTENTDVCDHKCKVNTWFWTKWFTQRMGVGLPSASKWAKTFARERITEQHLHTLAVKDLVALGLSTPQAQAFRRASGASRRSAAVTTGADAAVGATGAGASGGDEASEAARAYSLAREAVEAVTGGAVRLLTNAAAGACRAVRAGAYAICTRLRAAVLPRSPATYS